MQTEQSIPDGARPPPGLRDAILDCAVRLAEAADWEAVRLRQVADELGITLADIHGYFAEKDQLVDAWFDRADQAALAVAQRPGFGQLSEAGRFEVALLAWLDHLAPHRRVARQMIAAKAEFGHVHIQVPALMRISRTVQWFREIAGCDDALPKRAIAESVHTGIYLAVFSCWLLDDSQGGARARKLLGSLLGRDRTLRP